MNEWMNAHYSTNIQANLVKKQLSILSALQLLWGHLSKLLNTRWGRDWNLFRFFKFPYKMWENFWISKKNQKIMRY